MITIFRVKGIGQGIFIDYVEDDEEKELVISAEEVIAMKAQHDEQMSELKSELEKNVISSAASTLGSIKSEKKAKSSRENGMKGGRPKDSDDVRK